MLKEINCMKHTYNNTRSYMLLKIEKFQKQNKNN